MTREEIEQKMDRLRNSLKRISNIPGATAESVLANKRAELIAYATMWAAAE